MQNLGPHASMLIGELLAFVQLPADSFLFRTGTTRHLAAGLLLFLCDDGTASTAIFGAALHFFYRFDLLPLFDHSNCNHNHIE